MHSSQFRQHAVFAEALARWRLTPDGEAIVTHAARLLPVRWQGRPAMLKVATAEEERQGGLLMSWWHAQGAAEIFAAEADAIVMERGGTPLSALVAAGRDDEATIILCEVAAKLHAARSDPPPSLVPLQAWFADLQPAAAREGGLLARSAAEARALLADPCEETVLHGDIHHDNVLDFGPRGWLVIDPKGLFGERGFDYANLFCNPDKGDGGAFASSPERFSHRLTLVTEHARVERRRMLQWIIAWTGLSATWQIEIDESPAIDFAIMKLAIGAIDQG